MTELRTRDVVMSVEELHATRAERFGHADEIHRERFGGVDLKPVCQRCGAAIEQHKTSGFWQHVGPQPECAVATLAFRESRLA